MSKQKCPLCGFLDSTFLCKKIYYCSQCSLRFVENSFLPNIEQEKSRYEKHNYDSKYNEYIVKCLEPVNAFFGLGKLLDYGCGSKKVLESILKGNGIEVSSFDPVFYPDTSVLNIKYDIICCIEVVEHFHSPNEQFNLLRDILKDDGLLLIKTKLCDADTNFQTWWYARDCTHVSFYSNISFQFIAKEFELKIVQISDEHVILKKEKS